MEAWNSSRTSQSENNAVQGGNGENKSLIVEKEAVGMDNAVRMDDAVRMENAVGLNGVNQSRWRMLRQSSKRMLRQSS